MELYDELGVAPSATAAEIRAAYVRLAREFHPDHRPADDATAPRRMAQINAAWTVLSDQRRRAAYDASRAATSDRPRRSDASVRDAGATWTPLDDDEELDPAFIDDTPTGAGSVPRLVAMLPAMLFALGAVVMVFGFVFQAAPLLGLGMALVVAAGIAFIAIPVVAMIGASRSERDW